jgi:hypothetical protein
MSGKPYRIDEARSHHSELQDSQGSLRNSWLGPRVRVDDDWELGMSLSSFTKKVPFRVRKRNLRSDKLSQKVTQHCQTLIGASGSRATPSTWRDAALNAHSKWHASPVNGTGRSPLMRYAMSSSVWPGTDIAQRESHRQRDRCLPREEPLSELQKNQVLKNFDLPRKWFATAARARNSVRVCHK